MFYFHYGIMYKIIALPSLKHRLSSSTFDIACVQHAKAHQITHKTDTLHGKTDRADNPLR